jgi:hypothetical protein
LFVLLVVLAVLAVNITALLLSPLKQVSRAIPFKWLAVAGSVVQAAPYLNRATAAVLAIPVLLQVVAVVVVA